MCSAANRAALLLGCWPGAQFFVTLEDGCLGEMETHFSMKLCKNFLSQTDPARHSFEPLAGGVEWGWGPLMTVYAIGGGMNKCLIKKTPGRRWITWVSLCPNTPLETDLYSIIGISSVALTYDSNSSEFNTFQGFFQSQPREGTGWPLIYNPRVIEFSRA